MDHPTSGANDFNPTAADFRRALLAVRDGTPNQDIWNLWVQLLKIQFQRPERKITAGELADAASLKGYSEANLRYGYLAHAVATRLGYTPPNRRHGDKRPMWWMALSTGEVRDDEDQFFEFTMHPALAEALAAMRWV